MIRKLLWLWEDPFSGAILVSGSVYGGFVQNSGTWVELSPHHPSEIFTFYHCGLSKAWVIWGGTLCWTTLILRENLRSDLIPCRSLPECFLAERKDLELEVWHISPCDNQSRIKPRSHPLTHGIQQEQVMRAHLEMTVNWEWHDWIQPSRTNR